MGGKLAVIEDVSKPNAQQKEYRIIKEQRNEIKKKINKQIRGGLIAGPNEEIIRTKTHNNVTYYYIDDKDIDKLKARKFNEEKVITDFFSEREAFHNKQKRVRRGTLIEGAEKDMKIQDIKIEDFIKFNKINPKIFTAD